jgi:hypothetical protein
MLRFLNIAGVQLALRSSHLHAGTLFDRNNDSRKVGSRSAFFARELEKPPDRFDHVGGNAKRLAFGKE